MIGREEEREKKYIEGDGVDRQRYRQTKGLTNRRTDRKSDKRKDM